MMPLRQILLSFWSRASRRLADLWGRIPWARQPYRIAMVDDLPERLRPRLLYVVVEGRVEMQATMACPRGRCREPVNMNLMPDDHPLWTLKRDGMGLPTLSPSVWRKQDCGCHFWLRQGEITWCDE